MKLDLTRHTRCIVNGCQNHTDEGYFVGDLCGPCHEYIVTNNPNNSQAFRNAVIVFNNLAMKAIYG